MPKTPDYFAGKTVLITGAASGIGRATALIFAREGANVVCADINENGARETATEVNAKGSQALALKVDVTSRADVNAMAERSLAAFSRVHFLFNSAGAAIRRAKFLEIDDALMEKTFALNVNGTFYAMQALLPHFVAHKAGVIVNMASMAHRRGAPGSSIHYAAAKGAVLSMTLGVARGVCVSRHPRALNLARADQDAVPGGGAVLAGTDPAIPLRHSDGPLRRAGGDRGAGFVSVFRCLRVHDRGHGLCERRRWLAVGL
jgi:NAD(P)-dependent dehydrogenase (short-subunit alcohol dehydrogenase family)